MIDGGVELVAGWTRADLKARGFAGFVTFSQLQTADVPVGSGVYVVLRPVISEPSFLGRQCGWPPEGPGPVSTGESAPRRVGPGRQRGLHRQGGRGRKGGGGA